MAGLKMELEQLYNDSSKHANYQNIPDFVRTEIGYSETINETWRGDTARYRYLLEHIDFSGMVINDIGANTGFFTLSLAQRFKKNSTCVNAYECNENHSRFINLVTDYFSMENVTVYNVPVTFDTLQQLENADLVLLSNVLHHAGCDFDEDKVSSIDELKEYCINYLILLKNKNKRLVFQMGSNWCGNKKTPIINLEDDIGKMLFNSEIMTRAGWLIDSLALAKETSDSERAFVDIDQKYIDYLNGGEYNDESINSQLQSQIFELGTNKLSEFYRRPLLICSAK